MSNPENVICDCGTEMESGNVYYTCPLVYEFKCPECDAIKKIKGEGIKVLTPEEARKKRPELYKDEDLGEEIE